MPDSLPLDDLASRLRRFVYLSALIGAQFFVIYYGADWITAHRALRVHAYVTAELGIPLVPIMVVPYTTMYAIFLFAPFVLRSTEELDRFAGTLASIVAIAGLAFLLIPAQLGFAPARATGTWWDAWLDIAAFVSRPYNLVPSLHVALITAAVATYWVHVSTPARALLAGWLTIVAASTILTHQHHLIDVMSGLALGTWCVRATVDGIWKLPGRRRLFSARTEVGSRCSP